MTTQQTLSLRERAMIVSLFTKRWWGEKRDEEVGREVEEMKNAAANSGRYTKKLMESSQTFAEIKNYFNRLRSFHRSQTLPWSDANNQRLIMNEKYFDHLIKVGAMTVEIEKLVDQFIEEFEEAKRREAARLQGLFKESDYPHPDMLRDMFKVKIVFSPIPDTDDFRVTANDAMLEMLKDQLQRTTEENIRTANNELLSKVREAVNKLIEVLSDPDAGIRESLTGNIYQLTETLPIYNFSNDQKIKDVVEMLRPLCVDADSLKNSTNFRAEIVTKAKAVLEALYS